MEPPGEGVGWSVTEVLQGGSNGVTGLYVYSALLYCCETP